MAKLKCIIKTLISTFNCFTPPSDIQSITRDFPEDLVAEILSRIHIKTLVRWKCVCKKWHRMLSEPYFATLHLSRSPAGLITFRHLKRENFFRTIELVDKSDHHGIHQDPLTSLDLQFGPEYPDVMLCGSVNGLICVRKENEIAACVCNVITREYIRLPDHKDIKNQHTTTKFGFGFVKATDEYKVVCFYDRVPSTKGLHNLWCMVYTLGTDVWRDLGQVPFLVDPCNVTEYLYWCGSSDGTFFRGNLHWLVYDQKDINNERVCTFDLKNETLQLTPCPQNDEMEVNFRRLGILRECLCVCDTSQLSELVIWVMKNYGKKESWSKEIVIRDQNPSYLHGVVHPLKVFEDGTILLSSYCQLFTYDPRNKTFKGLDIFMEKPNFNKAVAMVFVPSFISLKSFM